MATPCLHCKASSQLTFRPISSRAPLMQLLVHDKAKAVERTQPHQMPPCVNPDGAPVPAPPAPHRSHQLRGLPGRHPRHPHTHGTGSPPAPGPGVAARGSPGPEQGRTRPAPPTAPQGRARVTSGTHPPPRAGIARPRPASRETRWLTRPPGRVPSAISVTARPYQSAAGAHR